MISSLCILTKSLFLTFMEFTKSLFFPPLCFPSSLIDSLVSIISSSSLLHTVHIVELIHREVKRQNCSCQESPGIILASEASVLFKNKGGKNKTRTQGVKASQTHSYNHRLPSPSVCEMNLFDMGKNINLFSSCSTVGCR